MYKNITEILVEQKLAALWKNYDGCTCVRCHDDIMCYALNRLPSKYVSTTKGELYHKAATLSIERDVEVTMIVTMAMEVVGKQPRHSSKKNINGSYDVFEEQD